MATTACFQLIHSVSAMPSPMNPTRIVPVISESAPIVEASKAGSHWALNSYELVDFMGTKSAWKYAAKIPRKAKIITVVDKPTSLSVHNPHDQVHVLSFDNDDTRYIVAPRSTETFQKETAQAWNKFTVQPLYLHHANIQYSG